SADNTQYEVTVPITSPGQGSPPLTCFLRFPHGCLFALKGSKQHLCENRSEGLPLNSLSTQAAARIAPSGCVDVYKLVDVLFTKGTTAFV
ncbi:MAG: hypothetical protein IKW76_07945, partial [Clostridia bacterium]|nr:hypothetical protein [Clostridia bacterium]